MALESSIIDKVRKLRALASSDNVNEAAAAARLAERLIQEHSIAEADIAASADEPTIKGETPIVTWGRVPTWQGQLLQILTRQYQCRGIYDRNTPGYRYFAFGRPSDLEMVRYQFAFYVTEIDRLTYKHGRGLGKTWGNSFRLGAVAAIREALTQATAETRVQATSTALAVVDRRTHNAEACMRTYYPRTSKRTTGSVRLDGDAYERGKQAGANMTPRQGLGQASGRLLKA